MNQSNNIIHMLERFGDVIYWTACSCAALTFLYHSTGGTEGGGDRYENIFMGVFFALLIWLFGLAWRYILTGRGAFSQKSKVHI